MFSLWRTTVVTVACMCSRHVLLLLYHFKWFIVSRTLCYFCWILTMIRNYQSRGHDSDGRKKELKLTCPLCYSNQWDPLVFTCVHESPSLWSLLTTCCHSVSWLTLQPELTACQAQTSSHSIPGCLIANTFTWKHLTCPCRLRWGNSP